MFYVYAANSYLNVDPQDSIDIRKKIKILGNTLLHF